jgi:hypothetical protein
LSLSKFASAPFHQLKGHILVKSEAARTEVPGRPSYSLL